MNEVIRFALLGLGVGAFYALRPSQGLISDLSRQTCFLNFSLGATAIAGVFDAVGTADTRRASRSSSSQPSSVSPGRLFSVPSPTG